jgi:hypothetical protein
VARPSGAAIPVRPIDQCLGTPTVGSPSTVGVPWDTCPGAQWSTTPRVAALPLPSGAGPWDRLRYVVDDSEVANIKNQASQHSDQVEQGIDKAGNTVDDKTGGKFSDQIDKGQDALKDKLGDL